jgi:Cupredoxin-like domain
MKVLTFAVLISVAPTFLHMTSALADDQIAVTLKNHKFSPSIIKVKANQPSMIILSNEDDTADEFDSSSLKVEKVVPGHAKGNVRIRALAPGKYPFMGEYHAATAQGVVVAE